MANQGLLHLIGEKLQLLRKQLACLADLRITFALMGLGCAVVLFVEPGRDVVRGLVANANSFIGESNLAAGAGDIMLKWFAFWLACTWTGITAWYWSSILYRTEHDTPPARWFDWIRLFLGVAPLACAIAAMWLTSEQGLRDIWIGGGLFLVTAIGLLIYFAARRGRFDEAKDAAGGLSRVDKAFIAFSLFVTLCMFAAFTIPGFRTSWAWDVGPAAIAFGAIGCIVPLSSVLIMSTRKYRLPIISIMLICAAAFSMWNDNHDIRALSQDPVRPRPKIEDALASWNALHPNPQDPIVLIATAGGASRASYWTGNVLRALEDSDPEGDFSRHVFAISGVSGGSLGAVGYAAWTADHQPEQGASPAMREERRRFLRDFFGMDYLAPAVAGMLFPDFLQRFLPVAVMPSRATSLEEAWEMGWDRAAGRCRSPAASPDCARQGRIGGDFLSIWDGVFSRPPGAPPRWVPIVLVNGTHAETGRRIITAPVTITPDVFDDTYDFFVLSPNPIRASTAILNSARFPLISPAGTISGSHGHIVDGGYFENGGLETVIDLARYIRSRDKRRRILIVEINNDDMLTCGDAARHVWRAEGAIVPPVEPTGARDDSPFLGEFSSILSGLYFTRDGRGILGAKRASSADLWLGDVDFFQFRLGELHESQRTTMSWNISQPSLDRMDVVFDTDGRDIAQRINNRNYSARRREAVFRDLQLVQRREPTIDNLAEVTRLTNALARGERASRAHLGVCQRPPPPPPSLPSPPLAS